MPEPYRYCMNCGQLHTYITTLHKNLQRLTCQYDKLVEALPTAKFTAEYNAIPSIMAPSEILEMRLILRPIRMGVNYHMRGDGQLLYKRVMYARTLIAWGKGVSEQLQKALELEPEDIDCEKWEQHGKAVLRQAEAEMRVLIEKGMMPRHAMEQLEEKHHD